MIDCKRCAFYSESINTLPSGRRVRTGDCVRELDPDICHEYEGKQGSDIKEGFHEVKMSESEYRDYIGLKDKEKLDELNKELQDIIKNKE